MTDTKPEVKRWIALEDDPKWSVQRETEVVAASAYDALVAKVQALEGENALHRRVLADYRASLERRGNVIESYEAAEKALLKTIENLQRDLEAAKAKLAEALHKRNEIFETAQNEVLQLSADLEAARREREGAYRLLEALSLPSAYEGERTGGVLEGCPRAPNPTPSEIAAKVRIAFRALKSQAGEG